MQDTLNPRTGAGTGYSIRADIDNPSGNAEGVIIAQGSRYGGFTLFVKDKRVHFEINSFSHNSGEMISTEELPVGHSMIVVNVIPEPANTTPTTKQQEMPFPGRGTLEVNDSKTVTTSFINIPAGGGYWSAAESLDVGSDLGSPVSSEYTSPNRFTGTINSVTLKLHSSVGTPTKSEKAARNDGHS
jgi:arylsulfatase